MREKIKYKGILYAVVVRGVHDGFVTGVDHSLQLGFHTDKKGKVFNRHECLPKDVGVVSPCKVYHVLNGLLNVNLYDEDDNIFEVVRLGSGDSIILIRGGHGAEVLVDNTCFLEVKQGPFSAKDKRWF